MGERWDPGTAIEVLLSHGSGGDLPWLWGVDPQDLASRIRDRQRQLQSQRHPRRRDGEVPRVVLVGGDPVEFWAGLGACWGVPSVVVLASPQWGEREWQQVWAWVQPHQVWGRSIAPSAPAPNPQSLTPDLAPIPLDSLQPGWVLIPTGGTSGALRFAIHTWDTLRAAVAGLQRSTLVPGLFAPHTPIHSFCTLPLHHVSGLMQGLRALWTGGQVAMVPFSEVIPGLQNPAQAPWRELDPDRFCLSLVPTQLQRLLSVPPALPWLAQFPIIFLGGAPPWPDLLTQARALGLAVAPTYGMTETAGQVATLSPGAFQQGAGGCGNGLPHAQVTIVDDQGQAISPGTVGSVALWSQSLALGYYGGDRPDGNPLGHPTLTRWCHTPDRPWITDDLGYQNPEGGLHVVGRNSHTIITGGEKVFPPEVEAAIRASGVVADVAVVGVGDRHWGEKVVALYVPAPGVPPTPLPPQLLTHLRRTLAPYKCPKAWIPLPQLPRNPQGKLDIPALQTLASQPSHTSPFP